MAFLTWWLSLVLIVACLPGSTAISEIFPDLYEASVLELQAGLDAGNFSSVDLVKVLNIIYNSFLSLKTNHTLSGLFCTN